MFDLDPAALAARARTSGGAPRVPGLADSLLRGTLGFSLVSLGGFGPWVLTSRWFHQRGGEGAMYAACAVVFIALSGWLLHPLIIGPGNLRRFYQVFGLGFGLYAIGWTGGWMAWGGTTGSLAGLALGTAAMGWVFARAFRCPGRWPGLALILFAGNTLGYFAGDWAHVAVLHAGGGLIPPGYIMAAKAVWGLAYGLGFGAGIGLVIYQCQTTARQLLRAAPPGAR